MRLQSVICAAVILAAASSPASAAPFSAVYVFGDSLSDNGNFAALAGGAGATAPVAPYDPQSASNGNVAVEYLAQSLSLPLGPGLGPILPGNNYAVIGATTGPVNGVENVVQAALPALPFPPTGLGTQVLSFLGDLGLQPIDPNALFFIWSGANDLFLDATTPTAQTAAGRVGLAVQTLYQRGARNFLIPNLPNLALAPGGSAAQGSASVTFNATLAFLLDQQSSLPGMNLVQFDTFSFINTVVASPATLGFTNVTTPCFQDPVPGTQLGLVPGVTCADPDQYLYWDEVHPTAAAHRQLGQAFVAAVAPVPEPLTLTLAGLGVAAVALRRRRAV